MRGWVGDNYQTRDCETDSVITFKGLWGGVPDIILVNGVRERINIVAGIIKRDFLLSLPFKGV